jgi:predicted nucleic acid-binding protein
MRSLLDINVIIALLDRGHVMHGAASHVFWPEQISLLNKGLIRWERMLGPRQITDSYLLALAVAHGGRFVSFDQRIRVDLVPNASEVHLAIIGLP